MDTRTISARLHDVLRPALRARRPDPARAPTSRLEDLDEVLSGLRSLIHDLGGHEPPRLPPRIQACASAMPEGRIGGTRATVQHRRRVRVAAIGAKPSPLPRTLVPGEAVVLRLPPSPREAAEVYFRAPEVDAQATA